MKSIEERIKDLLEEYNKETGIAVTHVSMNWYDVMGGSYAPFEIAVDTKTYGVKPPKE